MKGRAVERVTRAWAPFRDIEVRDSGAEAGAFTVKGHAAVFDQPCEFRWFTEYIAPGAFQPALAVEPLEVVSNWQHDDRWVLGHTLSNTLTLGEDAAGLMSWTRVAPTSYAADLRILLERGDIQQMSFCFIIGAEKWEYLNEGEDNEEVHVTVTEVKTLFDVTQCALAAYPQTDTEADSRSRLDLALRQGLVPGLTLEDAHERGILTRENPSERRQTPSPEEVATQARAAHEAADNEDGIEAETPAVPDGYLKRARNRVKFARATVPKG